MTERTCMCVDLRSPLVSPLLSLWTSECVGHPGDVVVVGIRG